MKENAKLLAGFIYDLSDQITETREEFSDKFSTQLVKVLNGLNKGEEAVQELKGFEGAEALGELEGIGNIKAFVGNQEFIKKIYSEIKAKAKNDSVSSIIESNGNIKVNAIAQIVITVIDKIKGDREEDGIAPRPVSASKPIDMPMDLKDFSKEDLKNWRNSVRGVTEAFGIDMDALENDILLFQELLINIGMTEEEFDKKAKEDSSFINKLKNKSPNSERAIDAYIRKKDIEFLQQIEEYVPGTMQKISNETDSHKRNKTIRETIEIIAQQEGYSLEEIDLKTLEAESVIDRVENYGKQNMTISAEEEKKIGWEFVTGNSQPIPLISIENAQEVAFELAKMQEQLFEDGFDFGVSALTATTSIGKESSNESFSNLSLIPEALDLSAVSGYALSNGEGVALSETISMQSISGDVIEALYNIRYTYFIEKTEDALNYMTEDELKSALAIIGESIGDPEISIEKLFSDESLEMQFYDFANARMAEMNETAKDTLDDAKEKLQNILAGLRRANFQEVDIQVALSTYQAILEKLELEEEPPSADVVQMLTEGIDKQKLAETPEAIVRLLASETFEGKIGKIIYNSRDAFSELVEQALDIGSVNDLHPISDTEVPPGFFYEEMLGPELSADRTDNRVAQVGEPRYSTDCVKKFGEKIIQSTNVQDSVFFVTNVLIPAKVQETVKE